MKIICFGDSLTSCGGPGGRFSDILQERFPQHQFINCGVGGDTLERARERLEADVLSQHPDIVLVEFGANDWWRNVRPYQAWGTDLEYLLRRIKAQGAQAVVLGVFGPWPDPLTGQLHAKTYGADERSLAYFRLEQDIARRYDCEYLPNHQALIINDRCCWKDRNHPNELGNRRIADILQPILEKLLGTTALPRRSRRIRSIRDFWEEAVQEAGENLAAVCGERRLTYAAADDLAAQLGAGLAQICQTPNPKIAVCLPNCLEYFLLYWAVIKIGGIIVPINPWLKANSLQSIFQTVKPDLLVIQNRNDQETLAAAAHFPNLPYAFLEPSGRALHFSDLFRPSQYCPRPELSGASPAIIMHTSGTTGAPKGAIMLHHDLIFNVTTTVKAHDFTRKDIHLLINPMFHCTALYSSLPSAAYQRTPLIITADSKPENIFSLIQQEHITTLLTVPTVLQRCIALPDFSHYRLDSLRVIGYAGSIMPVKTVRRLQELLPGVELHNFFGLTETTSATHVLSGEAALERPDSIGQLLPFVGACIIHEDGSECEPGQVGELLFARDNVISGYWNRPGLLETSLVELRGRTWFRTGDLACQDAEGFTFIKGRKKDMIIVGGENVFAVEVETALLAIPEIKEVAVIGVPATGIRESLGELIKAFVVLEPGCTLSENAIRKYCHQALPSYKIPHLLEFRSALPRNPAGKIMKNELQ